MVNKNRRYWVLADRNQALFEELEQIGREMAVLSKRKEYIKAKIDRHLDEMLRQEPRKVSTHPTAVCALDEYRNNPNQSLQQIANKLGKSLSTIQTHITKALKQPA